MKKIYLLVYLLLCVSFMSAQVFWTEDFETDGEGIPSRYTSSNVFNDGFSDHYGRTDGSNISGGYVSPSNNWFMAGEDLDDNGGDGVISKTTTFGPQVITGMTDIRFSGLFAQGSAGGLDPGDSLIVEYKVDAGAWVRFMQFSGVAATGFNVGWGEDLDFNGVGDDGVALSETFASFTKDIAVSGASLQLRVTAWAGSGNEEFAFDLFTLDDITGAPPTPTITVTPSSITGLDYVFGAGPSAIDSFTLSLANLSAPLSVSSVVNFEFSVDKTTWGSFPTALTVPVLPDTSIKLYVRLADPAIALPVNIYSETLTLSSTGATDADAIFSGEVSAAPCVQSLQTLPYNGISGTAGFDHSTTNPPPAAPAEVCGTNFLLFYTSTPSTDGSDNEFGNQSNLGLSGLSSADFGGEASFATYPIDVSGVTAVTIDAVGNTAGGSVFNGTGEQFEWWYTLDGGAQVSFFTTTSDGSLAAGVSPLDVTGVNEIVVGFTFNINGGGDGFEDVDVTVTEFIPNAPTITVASTSMSGFSVIEGTGPSTSIANSVEWSDLTGSVTSGNVVNSFEFSVDGGTTWSDATVLNVSIPIPFPGTSPAAVPVLVRLIGGLTAGTYFDTVVLSSPGATTVEVYLEGEVTPAPIVLTDCGDLFFSQYTESNGGNDKCYEIYNPTNAAIDLSNYSVDVYSNGSSTGSGPYALSGTIPAYGTWVVCNGGATAPYTAVADVVGGSLNNSTFYNGDDDLALLNSTGDIIDYIGQIGADPGSEYESGGVSTSDQNIQRLASVLKGDNNPNDTFLPDAEWVTIGTNVATGLGSHASDCAPFIWTGLVDTDWSTAGNWNKNTVPVASDEVVIPTTPLGANFPLVSLDITVEDLTIEAGASLNMAPSFGLIIDGSVVNNGTLTLQSSATGTAWLDDFSNSATYTGDITVQTFVTTGSGLGQRYFGSAVSGSSVQGLDGTYTGYPLGQLIPTATCNPNQLDAASPYSNLFEWNEDNTFPTNCVQEGWTAISAAASLTPGRAYSGWVNDGSIISVTGTPNTGNTVFSTSGVSGSSAGVPTANGWHLLANPFPSPLDVNSVFTSGFVSPQTYDGGSGPYSGTFNPVLITGNDLAVMQGFVARSNTGSTFTAAQADRVAGNELWLRPEFTHMLEVNIEGNNMADKTYVYFDSEATDVFDHIADCEKRESDFGHPTLFTNLNGQKMSLNGYAIDNMNRSVGMGLLPGSNGAFTLDFEGVASFPTTSLIFLEDKLTGDFVNLREQSTYAFAASTSDMADRFEIHFTAPITVTTADASCEGSDAEIVIDFGMNQVNNSTIKWDYNVEANNAAITSGTDVNGLISIIGMEEGVYNLVLNQNNYFVTIPVQLDGASRVDADFENPVAIEVGQSVTLGNLSSGGIDYIWTVEGQSFSAQDFNYTFNTAGTFDILLEASNEDCDAMKVKTIDVAAKTTGIRDAGDLALVNVFTQNATIVIDLSKLSLPSNSTIDIYNLLGQSIYSGEVGNSMVKVDTKNNSAYYFVSIRNKELQKVFKVLVK